MTKLKSIKSSEITPRDVWDRRRFLKTVSTVGLGTGYSIMPFTAFSDNKITSQVDFSSVAKSEFSSNEELTKFSAVTGYNNFYEFGTQKEDPAKTANSLKVRPWAITIDGELEKPLTIGIEDLLRLAPLEERIYRLRCVEGWSMVIPWIGYPLSKLLSKVRLNSKANYVSFTSLMDPVQMPGQKVPILEWPYTEGLRIDEAMNPLTLLTLGLYGQLLPNQNGAPVRIVVPWKYGFKSAKSIVRITLSESQPKTAWSSASPHEYGFYSNVNPMVDHPRWSQVRERRIGEFFKRDTQMFNGYQDQVAHLYSGMDLEKFF